MNDAEDDITELVTHSIDNAGRHDYIHPCICGHWSWHGLPVMRVGAGGKEEWCPGTHIVGER